MPTLADDHTLSFAEVSRVLGVSVMAVHHWKRRVVKRPALLTTLKWQPRRKRYCHAVRVDVLDEFLRIYRPALRYKLIAAREVAHHG